MKKALIRILRTGTGLLIAGFAVSFSEDPKFIVIAPILNGIFKYLRDKYGIKYLPL